MAAASRALRLCVAGGRAANRTSPAGRHPILNQGFAPRAAIRGAVVTAGSRPVTGTVVVAASGRKEVRQDGDGKQSHGTGRPHGSLWGSRGVRKVDKPSFCK